MHFTYVSMIIFQKLSSSINRYYIKTTGYHKIILVVNQEFG